MQPLKVRSVCGVWSFLVGVILVLGLSPPAPAVIETYEFSEPGHESRYQNMIAELRCLVCQNQNLADSNADLAKDLRARTYQMINQGATDQQIADFMIARYGDFVLLRPPFKNSTLILWIGPGVIFAIGIFGVTLWHRRRRVAVAAPVAPLSADERARVKAMLAETPEQ